MVAVLMVGIPASGKTTWARNFGANLTKCNASYIIISRDKIRKSLIGESSNYFSKETEVFNTFVNQINEAMLKYDCVFIDATHVSLASRRKIISHLTPPAEAQLFVKIMQTPFAECLKRNSKRSGFELVPTKVMYRMKNQIVVPTKAELEASWNPFKEIIIS